jgi:hypothetical protein
VEQAVITLVRQTSNAVIFVFIVSLQIIGSSGRLARDLAT